MSRNTRSSQKAEKSVSTSESTESCLATTTANNTSNDPQQKQEVTLQDIFSKLDRIENKIGNVHDRVELMESRLSKVEDDSQIIIDVNKDMSCLKNSNIDIMKRIEILENRDREQNIKILNLPVHPLETKTILQGKVIEILKHANPQITNNCVAEVRRLTARPNVGQDDVTNARPSTSQQGAAPGPSSNQRRAPPVPPVLVKIPNSTLVQSLLRQGNKEMRTYSTPNIRIVDDVSKQTQAKRAELIPKMKELRSAGLFAQIPFGPVAKLIYKQDNQWKVIFPENLKKN